MDYAVLVHEFVGVGVDQLGEQCAVAQLLLRDLPLRVAGFHRVLHGLRSGLRETWVDAQIAGRIRVGLIDRFDGVPDLVLDVVGGRRALNKELVVLHVDVREHDAAGGDQVQYGLIFLF